MVLEISNEDVKLVPLLTDRSDFLIWSQRMEMYLRLRKLWEITLNGPGDNPSPELMKKLVDSAFLITSRLNDQIFHQIVRPQGENSSNGYLIWKKLVDSFGRTPVQAIRHAYSSWENLRYAGDMDLFANQISRCLFEFDAIGHKPTNMGIGGTIVEKLRPQRPGLADGLILNEALMNDPDRLLGELYEIASNDQLAAQLRQPKRSRKTPASSFSRARTQRLPGCKNGIHHPSAAHPEDQCWALHPKKRPIRGLNRKLVTPISPAFAL